MSEVEETITISLADYNSLLEDSLWLAALEEAGVDNWEGISYAHELYLVNEDYDCGDYDGEFDDDEDNDNGVV